MITTITLLGSSSGRNAGDAALISGIADAVDHSLRRRVRYEIPTIKPNFIRENYSNDVHPVSMLPWSGSIKMLGVPTYRSIMRSDLSLIFDAILFDRSLYNPLFNHLSTLYLLLPRARKRGKLLGCFNVGAGPVTTPAGKDMLRKVCELMDFITVRDEDSRRILREIGVQNPHLLVTADAALNVAGSSPVRARELIQHAGLDADKGIMAVNISAYLDTWVSPDHRPMGRDLFLRAFAKGVEQAAADTGAQLLFVCTQYHDVSVTEEVMKLVRAPVKGLLSNRQCSHYDIKAVLAQAALLFGMRLHATILATSAFTPTVALPHQPKVNHYFRTLGLEKRVMSYDGFSAQSVAEALRQAWQEKDSIRETLRRCIPIQQRKARMAADLVAALDRGERVADAVQKLQQECARTPS